MLSDNATNIERALLATLPSEHRLTEQELTEKRAPLCRAFSDRGPRNSEPLLLRLQSKIAITMEMGTVLVEGQS